MTDDVLQRRLNDLLNRWGTDDVIQVATHAYRKAFKNTVPGPRICGMVCYSDEGNPIAVARHTTELKSMWGSQSGCHMAAMDLLNHAMQQWNKPLDQVVSFLGVPNNRWRIYGDPQGLTYEQLEASRYIVGTSIEPPWTVGSQYKRQHAQWCAEEYPDLAIMRRQIRRELNGE